MECSVIELSKYRFDCCREALEDAIIMYDAGRYKNALNRAYYSIFYAIRAVNALDGFDSSKHSGVIAHFNQNYVKQGVFSKEASKLIKLVSEKRENADSLDWKDYGVDAIIKTVTEHKHLGNGSIILCHNGAKYTAEALDTLITTLQDKGYELVPISELIYRDNYHLDHEGRQITAKYDKQT